MTIPNADHFLALAGQVIAPAGRGAPRQVDLRRAISSAYYSVFHEVLKAAADEFVGRTRRNDPAYALAYRRVDHAVLRDLCTNVQKKSLPGRYKSYEPDGGFRPDLSQFAAFVIELQQRRHAADYDPMIRLKRSDAETAVSAARSALTRFRSAPPQSRRTFLALLLFPPR